MMTYEEFVEKECHLCGSQRCYGVDYCGKYKTEVLGEKDPMWEVYEVIHTPEKTGAAMKHISELMDKHRAEHPEVYIADAEYESAAEEAHDNLVRSLVEAGGEIRELRTLLIEAKDALLYMLLLHKAQDPRYNHEKVVPALYVLQSEPDKWTPERVDEVFKKIFDYLEQEEDDGT